MQLSIYSAPFEGVKMDRFEEPIANKHLLYPSMCQVFG